MNFPTEAIKKIMNYLTTGRGTIPEMVKAATEVINWACELVWGQGLVTVQAEMPRTTDGQIAGLQALLDQHAGGVAARQWTVPQWLLPLMLELLKRWL